MEYWAEGAVFDLKHIFGWTLQMLRYLMSISRAHLRRGEDEHVQMPISGGRAPAVP